MLPSEPERRSLNRFVRGQVYESVVAGRRRCARVVAIVDYGRTGWLEFLDVKAPLFELSDRCMSTWNFVRQQ